MPEIQDIFRLHGSTHLDNSTPPPHVCKAVRAIRDCRTSALGGHLDTCDECGYVKPSYNSCRNRHCPKCQALYKECWVMARETDLLPVRYFHVVFTSPSELDGLVMRNPRILYDLLFLASSETLKELAADTKHLGAEIGFLSILHTWGQNLTLHPHVHMIVPGGGLTKDRKWRSSRKKFRGKFLVFLNQSLQNLRGSENDGVWYSLLDCLYKKDWYVYCKRPFKTTQSVLSYLGRYTHRVAISNHRILSVQDSTVSFKWRDYRDGSKEKDMTLTANEFMRRFLLHVLPPGFTKIRHYGFLASAAKKKKLALCKRLTGAKLKPNVRLSAAELMKRLTGRDITLCPVCGVGHFSAASGLSPPLGA